PYGWRAGPVRSLPAPYSFPTRRSSDLFRRVAADLGRGGQIAGPARGCVPVVPLHAIAAAGDGRHREAVARIGIAPEEAARIAQEDRKSTRLNSSHVKISYAVFCLKKKK